MQHRDQRLHWVRRFVEFVSLKVPQRTLENLREKRRGCGKVLFGRIEMWSCICSFLLISCLHVSFFYCFGNLKIWEVCREKRRREKKGFRWKSVSIWVLPCLKCCKNMCRYMHDNMYALDTCIFSRPPAHFRHTRSAYVQNSEPKEDPLITPCLCKGSIESGASGFHQICSPHCGHEMPRFGELRFVHLGCLRYWIRGRLNLTDGATGGVTAEHVVQSEEAASLRHSSSRNEINKPRRSKKSFSSGCLRDLSETRPIHDESSQIIECQRCHILHFKWCSGQLPGWRQLLLSPTGLWIVQGRSGRVSYGQSTFRTVQPRLLMNSL